MSNPLDRAEELIRALSEKEELARDELKELTGMGDEELEGALSALKALGFVEEEEGLIRWLGPVLTGRTLVIRGKIDYVIQSPIEVRVFGLSELRAKATA